MATATRTRKPRPLFTVTAPSQWNNYGWYADSKKLGMRYGPYDSEAEAQASADQVNQVTAL